MNVTADAPQQPSRRRPRGYAISPDRELGQNFLVDANILGVIDRAAALSAGDVVLEVGGGLGVLSEHLAPLCRHLHVVEVDRRLAGPLEELAAAHENVTLHWGDALRLDFTVLEPPPSALVANLPYGIAAPLLLETVERLRSLQRWTAMVQREVGERLAAAAGDELYGAPSVQAQLECDVRVVRRIPRTVFDPVPNVDSVLLTMTRAREPASAELRALVRGAFAHRRKTLAGSLALAGPGPERAAVRAALERIGLPADARAERLAPADFRRLAAELAT